MPPLIAHQGGWDEFLVLLSPIVILVGLRLFERRRSPKSGQASPSEATNSPTGGDGGSTGA